MAAPKILILTGDAAESLEVMYPYQRLREEGYDVLIVAPNKKKSSVLSFTISSPVLTPTPKSPGIVGTPILPSRT